MQNISQSTRVMTHRVNALFEFLGYPVNSAPKVKQWKSYIQNSYNTMSLCTCDKKTKRQLVLPLHKFCVFYLPFFLLVFIATEMT